jgi:excisionase family DNA binding protein
MSERRTLTVEEAGRLLGVSRGLAYEAARSGDLPTVRLGRRLLVPRARLYALLGEDLAASIQHAEGGEVIEEGNGLGASVSASDRGDVNGARS